MSPPCPRPSLGPLAHLLWLVVLLALACAPKVPALAPTDPADDPPIPEDVQTPPPLGEPHVFVLDPARLLEHKLAFQKDREHPSKPVGKLLRTADRALTLAPFSVMEKKETAPSGDRHDYLSLSPYHWPNPAKKNGLPYVFRDGQFNPAHAAIPDHDQLAHICRLSETLGLAYYLTDDDKYAARLALFLRTFFLAPETRMNPHLTYAGFARGLPGRQASLIDFAHVPELLDGIGMIETSSALTPADRDGLKSWFSAYLKWIRTSKDGHGEGASESNRGDWYDLQVVALALATGQRQLARTTLKSVRPRRIKTQIGRDGRLTYEFDRTRSWHYSNYALAAFEKLAYLGDRVRVPLWTYQTKDGRSMRKAIEYMIPFAQGKRWPVRDIGGVDTGEFWRILYLASVRLADDRFARVAATLPHDNDDGAFFYDSPKEAPASTPKEPASGPSAAP